MTLCIYKIYYTGRFFSIDTRMFRENSIVFLTAVKSFANILCLECFLNSKSNIVRHKWRMSLREGLKWLYLVTYLRYLSARTPVSVRSSPVQIIWLKLQSRLINVMIKQSDLRYSVAYILSRLMQMGHKGARTYFGNWKGASSRKV